jgi:DNA-binding transcriptional MerR regulator/predicted transcriptional regulator YdeE
MPPHGERLLTIGEFSRLSQLSVRMLRYYDEHDVLRPSRVDRHSGYRSYAPTLLHAARWVRELRDIGLGVHEIAACVPVLDDPRAVRAVLERQRTRLIAEAADVVDRIREVDHLVTALEGPAMSVAITHRTNPARLTASVRGIIPTYADEGRLWERLMPALFASGATLAPDARSIAVFHDDDYRESDCDVEVQLDVAAPFAESDEVRCVEVPAQEVAVAVLDGPYEGIGAVMEAVGRWVPENGYRFAGPMFNVYLVSPHEDPEPSHWVTEVCVPVARSASSDVPGAAAPDAR